MSALVIGTLRIGEPYPCVALESASGRLLVVWPIGTTWSADRSAIVLPNHVEIRSGQRVRGDGGYVSHADADRLVGPVDASDGCPEGGGVAVFNPGAEITVLDGG